MTIAVTCVLIAGVLPLFGAFVAKRGMKLDNNRAPREYLASLDGVARRANWAQQNAFEAFPFFAAAVLSAEFREAPQETVNALAMGFIIARLAYFGAYLADTDRLRSLFWLTAFGVTIALFFV